MARRWQTIPNFDDELAETRQTTHPQSGAQRVDVLYGARDAEGNPIAPSEGSDDGHGHWVALEIEGVYQMFFWRHPASEGGYQQFGTGDPADALGELEADIKAKEELCAQAEELAASDDWRQASTSFGRMFDTWRELRLWHTPRETELWERFKGARGTFYERRDEEHARNKAAKEALIAEAKELAESSEWESSRAKMDDLFARWKQAGHAGKDDDEALWTEFNAFRRVFFDRRKEHYRQLDAQHAQAREAKQALIAQAKGVMQEAADWKTTGDKLDELMEQWKAAGSAGRTNDGELWREFNGIRKDFYDRRRSHFETQRHEFEERAERKSAIIAEAASIAEAADYSDRNTERMKELDEEYKQIGFCGRENERRLWSLFRVEKDKFWNGKRAAGEQRREEWRSRMQEVIERKRDRIANLQRQVDDLRDRLEDTTSQERIDNMNRWIEEKEATIREVEADIHSIEKRM